MGFRVEIVAWPERRAAWVSAGVEPPPWPWPHGFRVPRRRWIVERTLAWLGKEYDALPATSEGWIDLTMIRLLADRLAR